MIMKQLSLLFSTLLIACTIVWAQPKMSMNDIKTEFNNIEEPAQIQIYEIRGSEPAGDVTIKIDTVSCIAMIGEKQYTIYGAFMTYEYEKVPEMDWFAIHEQNGRALTVNINSSKYGPYYTINDSKTRYYSLWEVWYKRLRQS